MWTIKNKALYILYCILGKWLPESRHFLLAKKIRNFFARRIMDDCGKNINIERNAYFTPGVSLGEFSGIGINCEINATGDAKVIIGNYVMMGPECIIYTSQHASENTDIPMQKQGMTEAKNVIIGDDVWIGRRVIIMPSVTIGKGSIIGAGAVVTKDIPDYSVAVGVPAKVIRSRKK